MPGGGEHNGPQERALTYCIVPHDLAEKLHGPLRRHFRDDPAVEVIVEQRGRERRHGVERRAASPEGTPAVDRRRVRNTEGRRISERRAVVAIVDAPALPRRARPHADELVFIERLEPSSLDAEDVDTARLVTSFQAGDTAAFSTLYRRYFDRVYGYLVVAFRDAHDAEDATQEVFMRVFKALPEYERRGKPFRAWLFTILRHYALDWLGKQGRIDVVEPTELSDRRERDPRNETELEALSWISDRELVILIERLPLAQRQVLVLRYMFGLRSPEIAVLLERSPSDVRMLQSRALAFLRERVSGLGRQPARHTPRSRSRRSLRPAHVLRSRRFVLR